MIKDNRKFFWRILFLLILTNSFILFNVSILRQIFGFATYSVIPGLLLLLCFKAKNLNFWKWVGYSIGLSVSYLVLLSLFINFVLPYVGIEKPLTSAPTLISFTLSTIALWFVAFRRNFSCFICVDKKRSHSLKDLIFFVIPFLFPILAIIGSSHNLISLFLIGFISLYAILIVIFSKKGEISEDVFPLAIFMIALALLLMISMGSVHIFGCDIHGEYLVFQMTKENGIWNPNVHAYNPCLSVTLLPTIYSLITNINDELIFTVFFPILFALVPVIIFLFVRKYTGPVYAFLSAFFFLSIETFSLFMAIARNEMALLFFALSILVFFDDEINKNIKKILFIIFGIIVVLSHYTTSYIYFGFLLVLGISSFFEREKIKRFKTRIITSITLVFFLVLIFFWYGQITTTPFNGFVLFIKQIFQNLANLLAPETRSLGAITSVGIPSGEMLFKINKYISALMKLFIVVGTIYLIRNFKQLKVEKEFVAGAIYFLAFVILSIILPIVTLGFNIERIFLQSLVMLCFCCILGSRFIFNKLKIKNKDIIIVSLLILFFLFQSGFVYKISGNPSSPAFGNDALAYRMWHVHEHEIASAEWISRQNPETVCADHDALLRLWSYGKLPYPYTAGAERKTCVLAANSTATEPYVYLRYDNVVSNSFLTREAGKYVYIENFTGILSENDKIYDDGGSQIFK